MLNVWITGTPVSNHEVRNIMLFILDSRSTSKAWFLLDRNGIVKSYDLGWFKLIGERLIKTENKNLTKIASDLQPKRFLS